MIKAIKTLISKYGILYIELSCNGN